ncbi:cytochrome c oxidase assembly protein [Roseitranquillus sediminis]|uniref:cytochrome c oxidase assembly protein n=1 Tax=Roseitranquillus sediminis TaxID=2809051 RepID=UPI001D0C34A8|nr:cytochrome c oxidase assembly protein [Roseitranquillus sediminis]MBM9593405.1 cytochrome c oxidase assembly protein [Roseitranquillus sediminis]
MEGIYCGPPPVPHAIWASWNFDPYLLGGLLLLAAVAGRDRTGAAAVGVLVVAFVSPLCALSSALFSARVVHHLLLVAVAAPLFAWSMPAWRTRNPGLSFTVSTAVLWVWHVPSAYDLALSHMGVYWLMQVSLVTSALWYWRDVFAADRSPVEALALVVAGFTQMGMLGAILTFAPQQLYAAHAVAPLAWSLTPLADQQLGGLLMWVPAGLPYAVAAGAAARRGWSDLKGRGA